MRKPSSTTCVLFQVIALIFYCGFSFAVTMAQGSDELHIHVVDVGTGDAMVVDQPGSCTFLIDAGQVAASERVIEKLGDLQVEKLDMVIVSHPHSDHFGGLFDILPRFPAAQFYDNGYEIERWALFDDYKELRKLQPYRTLTHGDTLACGDMKISVLHPRAPLAPVANLNDTSLILSIAYHDFRLLHMADLAGSQVSKFIALNDDLHADVIKISHHGMKDSASEAILDKVAPDYAIISSVGKCSSIYGCSPDESVLNRLRAHDISYFRTDRDGDIEIIVNLDSYKVTAASD